MERFYIEATIMGLCIGLATLLIDRWVGDASWPARIVVLMLVGGALCLMQYGLVRVRRK